MEAVTINQSNSLRSVSSQACSRIYWNVKTPGLETDGRILKDAAEVLQQDKRDNREEEIFSFVSKHASLNITVLFCA